MRPGLPVAALVAVGPPVDMQMPMAHHMGMGQAMGYQQPTMYDQLLPVMRGILEVVLDSDSEDSLHSVLNFTIRHRFNDNMHISEFLVQEQLLRAKMLEALAHWIRGKMRRLDMMVPQAQAKLDPLLRDRFQNFRLQLEQASYQSPPSEVLAEFVYCVSLEVMGPDTACLGSALAGLLVQERNEAIMDIECPALFLALLVRKLEEIQSSIAKVIMIMYRETGYQSWDASKEQLMMFFQYYTVDTITGTLEVHEHTRDIEFSRSAFKVHLVDTFGCLLKLLCHLETACNGHRHCLAVDFEGVRLNRSGPLCLVQITCSDDPTLVYIMDVHVLKHRSFTMESPGGTSMRKLLADRSVRKVWFDPRNDADALYHQFQILPQGIFDLQLAEVADRRSRGLNVTYVSGLQKCLSQCPNLGIEERHFAKEISRIGKSLYEPQNGGSYEVFRSRPLNPVILVYAAHDSRYMLLLYDQYTSSIGDQWIGRVLDAGDVRAQQCLNLEYVIPDSQAPQF